MLRQAQQADYHLIEPVEMSELKCSLFPTTYLIKSVTNYSSSIFMES